ncbi:B9 domain-containing protein 2 [Diachasma alloeum]|uniref:B9 domain-containing protein 2 n=1 Tax=Diachasma alloeum TaxID=454923 RepID=UPI00073835A6|nr:B9 domain-containing protein 2 [Diachasma alloeum]
MAELHVFGELAYAENFKQATLFCKWSFHAGNGWKLINGNPEGQTQECQNLYTGKPTWSHPIDLHYSTQSIQGAPKLLIQVFCRDNYGRILFIAYGICPVPLTPGFHEVKCHTWKPIGNWQDRLRDRFLGMSLQLKTPNLLTNGTDRFELLTESMGTVHLEFHILTQNFNKFGCFL